MSRRLSDLPWSPPSRRQSTSSLSSRSFEATETFCTPGFGGTATPSEGSKAPLGRISRAKTCVCASAMQLSRERTRLVSAEHQLLQRSSRLRGREEVVADKLFQLEEREQDLSERRADYIKGEASVAAQLQDVASLGGSPLEAELACDERRLQHLRRDRAQRRLQVQKRVDRVTALRHGLEKDRAEVADLEAELTTATLAPMEAQEGVSAVPLSPAAAAERLDRQRAAKSEAASEVSSLREVLLKRQAELDSVRCELQRKEADLDGRFLQVQRQREALAAREHNLRSLDAAELRERREELRGRGEEVERRLERLWDDIHQRQEALDDIQFSVSSREERLRTAQRSLLTTEASSDATLEKAR